ncbi:Rid family detoxifying hydrolase [Gordonia jinhuaensis]|uniref:Endoribonuclease L-PSP n=1 Tax=Gordonia jinhuaensis TaxID=1517702 RepID=A0A916TJZ7_9ACTN|nr:RidA family protein [Gordonia jinhuaensis]GGB48355.1 endoribonuclease L-PSP [Gordonia jinhuaensis]
MEQIKAISSSKAPGPVGAYTPAVCANGWCFVSGQVGWNADFGGLAERSPAEQTVQALANIEALLMAAGSSLAHVVKTTVYVNDPSIIGDVNQAYESALRAAGVEVLPARTLISGGIPVSVEIDVIARCPE